jgi:hypothetical protein
MTDVTSVSAVDTPVSPTVPTRRRGKENHNVAFTCCKRAVCKRAGDWQVRCLETRLMWKAVGLLAHEWYYRQVYCSVVLQTGLLLYRRTITKQGTRWRSVPVEVVLKNSKNVSWNCAWWFRKQQRLVAVHRQFRAAFWCLSPSKFCLHSQRNR